MTADDECLISAALDVTDVPESLYSCGNYDKGSVLSTEHKI